MKTMLSTFNILLLLLPVVASYTCYKVDGSIDTSLTVCDPSAAISPCCHTYEYCLSNGLCINAGANNLLTVEGCTDASWNTPCHPYCKATAAWFSNSLFPCYSTENTSTFTISYCCGPDPTSCCENGSAFPVPGAQIVLRPGEVLSSANFAALTTSSAGPTTTPPQSSMVVANETYSATPTATAPSSPSSTLDTRSLAIGLGIGVPLGLALIAALIYLAYHLRRYNKARTVPVGEFAPTLPKVGRVSAELRDPIVSGYPPPSELDTRGQIHELSYGRT